MNNAYSGNMHMQELDGPIPLDGEWPRDWDEACIAAVSNGSGLYMAQRGEYKQAITVNDLDVMARHWKGEWENVAR
jgi:hypothetical protein